MYGHFMLSKELVSASSKPLVLSILSEGESYGYAIIQQVRALSDEKITWTDGMLYPVLHRLEDEGLIRSNWRESPEGRERKYYRITPDGRRTLEQEKEKWMTVHQTLARLWKMKPASA
jgi:PadR family transcriptional regulator PadR